LGVYPSNTTDSEGRERFHHFSPEVAFGFNPREKERDWWMLHMIDFRNGSECCSPTSVSFHGLKENGRQARAIDAYLSLCSELH
jgi:hypothetical protein